MREPRVRRVSVLLTSLIVACSHARSLPTGATRASGQSHLMGDTFAGGQTCDTTTDSRPFAIEWDATDRALFEARTDTDVVFVRYEGCALEVVEGCVDGALPGRYGTYRPITWTSGAVESIEIGSEAELHAKLPLGSTLLGGRVASGESFRMEYFVSGVKTSTRDEVYRASLGPAACARATHYVHAINLGAFELVSTSHTEGDGGVQAGAASAGASSARSGRAEKTAGSLAACTTVGAQATHECRVPIRLVLRPTSTASLPKGRRRRSQRRRPRPTRSWLPRSIGRRRSGSSMRRTAPAV